MMRAFVAMTVAGMLLAGCSSSGQEATPETAPVEASPEIDLGEEGIASAAPVETYDVGRQFTLAWKEAEATDTPEDVNITFTVTGWRCGDQATPYLTRGKRKYEEDYGQASDAKVDGGYQLCVALLKVANTGKRKYQLDPVVKAVDPSAVEYDADDELTSVIGNEITRNNRESYGSAIVSMNPRETAVTAAAFQIPADTTIANLMIVGGSVYSEASRALVRVS
ncbi:hypothetical protein [Actinoplanes aureus]|uniref:Lipoprotein n=1 Tax=Actinoplanes aureus TaxID=2792083 RepID=A0A931CBJ2_9ACTN|nr:hypothetical protein [Actinoplanes aureus]MBG0565669.1 hypothetical protein [Actinoplanes aureus]